MGPAFVDAGFSSGDIMIKLMNNEYPGMPLIMFPLVDVRETAIAHLLAIQKPEVANQRFCLVNRCLWFREVATALKTEFDPQGYKINNKEMNLSDCTLMMLGWFIKELALVRPSWNKTIQVENTKSVNAWRVIL